MHALSLALSRSPVSLSGLFCIVKCLLNTELISVNRQVLTVCLGPVCVLWHIRMGFW